MHNRLFIFILTTLLLSQGRFALAQQNTANQPEVRFLKDTIKVGEPVQISLSYRHPVTEQAIFPDSTYDFSPFEYQAKEFYPTQSDASTSLDSVVYTLVSFETDPVLSLTLPVFKLTGQDSIPHYSNPGQIYVTTLVDTLPPEITMVANTAPMSVSRQFNYPYVIIATVLVAGFLVLVFMVFGKTIERYYSISTLRLRQKRYELAYKKQLKQWETRKSSDVLERILLIWKAHLERLDNKTYSAFTSKEIIATLPDYPLKDTLQLIDASIYGSNDLVVPASHLEHLLEVSRLIYTRRKEQLRNG
jgi:hypothetical protein